MSSRRRHRLALFGTLAFVGGLAILILYEVLWTVVFAITVAYVLYPLRRRLADRGLPPRLASGLASTAGLGAVVLLVTPLIVTIYQRRTALIDLVRQIPETVTLQVGGLSYVVDVPSLREPVQTAVTAAAVDLARAAPALAAKLFLFGFVVYGVLLRPHDARRAALALVPTAYHDILLALHRRMRDTLYALYVLQAVTAAVTFGVALAVFVLFGYESPFVLAVIAGILQFIPIVGPSLVVLILAAFDIAFGDPTRGVAILVVGLVAIGFLPDILVRARLAARTARLPASVYFIGFTGGLFSLGAIGIVVGPLVIALLVEVVDQISVE